MRQTMFLFLILIVPGVTCGEDEIQTTELKVVPQALSNSLGTDTFLFRDYDLTDSDAAILITTACAGMRDNLQNHFFDLTKQYLEIPFATIIGFVVFGQFHELATLFQTGEARSLMHGELITGDVVGAVLDGAPQISLPAHG